VQVLRNVRRMVPLPEQESDGSPAGDPSCPTLLATRGSPYVDGGGERESRSSRVSERWCRSSEVNQRKRNRRHEAAGRHGRHPPAAAIVLDSSVAYLRAAERNQHLGGGAPRHGDLDR